MLSDHGETALAGTPIGGYNKCDAEQSKPVRGRTGFDRTNEVSVACPGFQAAWLNTWNYFYLPITRWQWPRN